MAQKNKVLVIGGSPADPVPHFTIFPDYIAMELEIGKVFWGVHVVILVDLDIAETFNHFESFVKNNMYRLPHLSLEVPVAARENSTMRRLDFSEVQNIDFKLNKNEGP